jgi:hypothetical protein
VHVAAPEAHDDDEEDEGHVHGREHHVHNRALLGAVHQTRKHRHVFLQEYVPLSYHVSSKSKKNKKKNENPAD